MIKANGQKRAAWALVGLVFCWFGLVAAAQGQTQGQAPAPGFDVNALERQNRLEAAYDEAVAESSGFGGLFGRAGRQQQIDLMRERLVLRELSQLDAELKRARQIFGVASLAFVEQFRAQGSKLLKFDPSQHAAWLQRLDIELDRARKVMETVRAKLEQTAETDFPARLDLLKSLALLGGAGSEEEKIYLAALAVAKEKVYAQGRQALEESRPAVAASAFEYVLRLDANYLDAARLFLLAKLGAIEMLWAEAGDEPARIQALSLLKTTLSGAAYARFKTELAPAVAQIQARQLDKVKLALEQSRLIDAIQGVLQGRQLATLIAGVSTPVMTPAATPDATAVLPEDTALLEKLRAASERAVSAGFPGLAYLYQRVADDLLPRQEVTQRLLRERRQSAAAALTPAVAVEVSVAPATLAVLPSAAAAFNKALDQRWPAGVRRHLPAPGAPAPVWQFDLRVADVGIDNEERQARKRVRTPAGEEISVELALLRKSARLPVGFLLAEPGQPGALEKVETFKLQVDDERHDGVEVGGFSLPVKVADLPADAVLVERLLGEAAAYATARLVEAQRDPAEFFKARAERLLKAGLPLASVDARALAALAREQGLKSGSPSPAVTSVKADYDRAQIEALQLGPAVFAPPR